MCQAVSMLSWSSKHSSAIPKSDEDAIKTADQSFQWAQWIISKRDVQIIAQSKNDYRLLFCHWSNRKELPANEPQEGD